MYRTRIKICGITNVEDALLAAQLGADAIGLNFYHKSTRCVTIDQAKTIIQALPPFVTTVALFVNADRAYIVEVLHQISFDLLQFHGHETPEECASYHKPYIKALHMKSELNITQMQDDYRTTQGFLCDAYHAQKPGGTGTTFDWQLIPKNFTKPIILAGGLNPANIIEAVQQVKPYAVDVTSGVEQSPGIKDPSKLKEFITKVQDYDNHQQNKI